MTDRPDEPGRPGSSLAPYRVLDLTEGGVNWAGRLLSDMGADVIRIEPPGGSPTRKRGPSTRTSRIPSAASTGRPTTSTSAA